MPNRQSLLFLNAQCKKKKPYYALRELAKQYKCSVSTVINYRDQYAWQALNFFGVDTYRSGNFRTVWAYFSSDRPGDIFRIEKHTDVKKV